MDVGSVTEESNPFDFTEQEETLVFISSQIAGALAVSKRNMDSDTYRQFLRLARSMVEAEQFALDG